MMQATSNKMLYRRFGRTELRMPVYSCGGMRYQDGWKDKPLSDVDPAVHDNLVATINRSLELGINHIETARGYGVSERQLGVVLPELERDSIIVQTKIAPEADPQVFYDNFMDSLKRLNLQRVDLLALHGINNEEKLNWSIRNGGCFEMAQKIRDEGHCDFIGFSTHGSVDLIHRAIDFGGDTVGTGFDYVNLHWYYIYQETWSCIEAATSRDMGVFIISPSDKGGKLYHPSEKLRRLCSPLHPMTFNDLFCLSHPQVHTLSIGAARPSDFEEHLDALPLLNNPSELLRPILERLASAYNDVVEPSFRDPWNLGLPKLELIPGQINIGRILQLWNLVKAYDMVEYGKFRYNILGNAGDWFPGEKATPDRVQKHKAELESLLKSVDGGGDLLHILEDAHALLFKEETKRLSES